MEWIMSVMSTLVFLLVFLWLVLSGLHFLRWRSKYSPETTIAKYPKRTIVKLMLFFPVDVSATFAPDDFDLLTHHRRKVWTRYLAFIVLPIVVLLSCVQILSTRIDQMVNEIHEDAEELERRIDEVFRTRGVERPDEEEKRE